jgi:hypothetical protein
MYAFLQSILNHIHSYLFTYHINIALPHTAAHYRAHCRNRRRALPHTAAHCSTTAAKPHTAARTAIHYQVPCRTQPCALPHTVARCRTFAWPHTRAWPYNTSALSHAAAPSLCVEVQISISRLSTFDWDLLLTVCWLWFETNSWLSIVVWDHSWLSTVRSKEKRTSTVENSRPFSTVNFQHHFWWVLIIFRGFYTE